MSFEVTQRQMRLLAYASREEKKAAIGNLSVSDALDFDAEFENWAHKAQLPPRQEGWRTWLMMAGRGFGKTRAGAEWVEKIARSRPGVRIALVESDQLLGDESDVLDGAGEDSQRVE